MMEIEVESLVGRPNYKVRGEDEDAVTEAASEFQKSLDAIDHFPFDWNDATEQTGSRKKDIEEKYHIEITR